MTKYAHLPALVDDDGVMVGYVDANGKERNLSGAMIPPGTTPTPGGGTTVTSDDITDATATGRAVLTAASTAAARTAIGAGTSSLVVATTAPAALAATAAVGVGTTAARADHVHAIPGASNGTLRGTVLRAGAQADSVAADAAALVVDFNLLLAKLRTAGVIAP